MLVRGVRLAAENVPRSYLGCDKKIYRLRFTSNRYFFVEIADVLCHFKILHEFHESLGTDAENQKQRVEQLIACISNQSNGL